MVKQNNSIAILAASATLNMPKRGDVLWGISGEQFGLASRVEGYSPDGANIFVLRHGAKEPVSLCLSTLIGFYRVSTPSDPVLDWPEHSTGVDGNASSNVSGNALRDAPAKSRRGGKRHFNKRESISQEARIGATPGAVDGDPLPAPPSATPHFGPDPLPSSGHETVDMNGRKVRIYVSQRDGSRWAMVTDAGRAMGLNRSTAAGRAQRSKSKDVLKLSVVSDWNGRALGAWLVRREKAAALLTPSRKGYEDKKEAQAPAVTAPPPAPANPTAIASAVGVSDVLAMIEKSEARMGSMFAELLRVNNAQQNAFMERFFEKAKQADPARPTVDATAKSTSKDQKEAAERETNARIIGREREWAAPLIEEFIAAEMERVHFDTPQSIARAMFPGEFNDALAVWCKQNDRQKPDPRTVFAILDALSPRRLTVGTGSDKKQKTEFARRRQMDLDLHMDGDDFSTVVRAMRQIWPAFNNAALEGRIKTMLATEGKSNGATKSEMMEAVRGAAIEQKRPGAAAVTPGLVFASPSSIRVYARIAQDFGGQQ